MTKGQYGRSPMMELSFWSFLTVCFRPCSGPLARDLRVGEGLKMRNLLGVGFSMALLLALGAGCGDDAGGAADAAPDAAADATPAAVICPAEGPDPEGLSGPCCARRDNSDRRAAPEFRLSGLSLSQPRSIGNPIVRSALNSALESELFNWLIRVEGADADGAVTITTGYGVRNADNTFSFADGDAPGPGDPDRWNPESAAGTLAGELITTELVSGTLVIPVFEEDGETVAIELPLSSLELLGMEMSHDRSCVGDRLSVRYDTRQAQVRTFMTVEAALAGRISIPPIDSSLCNFIRGAASSEVECTEVPQSEWDLKPDAICDAAGCREAGDASEECDPDSTCNAWVVLGEFAAHAIEIVP